MTGTVVFDLDRTLTRQPTWLRFVLRMNRHRAGFWLSLPWLATCALAHKARLLDRTGIKNRFLATLSWADRAAIEAGGKAFAADEIRAGLRRGARSTIGQHRAAGARIYLATAASDFIAAPIAEALGLDGVICTRTDWSQPGRASHRVAGRNCHGPEKLRRVAEALARGQISRPVTVYSDDVSDLGLLLFADRGVAANPSAQLRRAAGRHGLETADLDDVPPLPRNPQVSLKHP